MIKKRQYVLIEFLILLAVVLGGCSSGWPGQKTQESSRLAVMQAKPFDPTPTPMVISRPEQVAATRTTGTLFRSDSGSQPVYSGEILAEHQVLVTAQVVGQVVEMSLEVGDSVRTGDVLLQVDTASLEAQRAQALATLEAAQAQLELLTADPETIDLEATRAAVSAANAAYQRALEGPTPEDLTTAKAQLRQAQAAVKRAQAAYDQVAWSPVLAALPESLQLEQSTLTLEAAQAQYDKLVKGSTADVIAAAYAQLAGARAQLQRLEEGAKPAQIRAAKAQVTQAEMALYLAQLQLDKATVRAPVGGIVAQVNTSVGTMIGPTAPILVLISHDIKVLIAVEEIRLPDVEIGQPVTIQVDAFPNRQFPGVISIVAPTLDPATRTVQVTVHPAVVTTELAPGMLATVTLEK